MPQGDVVFAQGDPAREFFVLVIRPRRRDRQGRRSRGSADRRAHGADMVRRSCHRERANAHLHGDRGDGLRILGAGADPFRSVLQPPPAHGAQPGRGARATLAGEGSRLHQPVHARAGAGTVAGGTPARHRRDGGTHRRDPGHQRVARSGPDARFHQHLRGTPHEIGLGAHFPYNEPAEDVLACVRPTTRRPVILPKSASATLRSPRRRRSSPTAP